MNKDKIQHIINDLNWLATENDFQEFDEDLIIIDFIDILKQYKDFLGDDK